MGSSDEKVIDSCDYTNKKPKGKKRKKAPRDVTAPRQPLTGYVRFLNDRREKVRADNPGLPFSEMTKLMAVEWSQLLPDQKKQYLDAAELDRDRYSQEMNAYKQTEAYKIFAQKQSEKKHRDDKPDTKHPTISDAEPERYPFFSSFEIPIFTEEFLDHNKSREVELRQLRKSNIDFEQQNAILHKHIEDMKVAVEKVECETTQARSNNAALSSHLQQMRAALTKAFVAASLPGVGDPPTLATIDSFMTRLDGLLQDPSTTNRDVLADRVRDHVTRLDFHC